VVHLRGLPRAAHVPLLLPPFHPPLPGRSEALPLISSSLAGPLRHMAYFLQGSRSTTGNLMLGIERLPRAVPVVLERSSRVPRRRRGTRVLWREEGGARGRGQLPIARFASSKATRGGRSAQTSRRITTDVVPVVSPPRSTSRRTS